MSIFIGYCGATRLAKQKCPLMGFILLSLLWREPKMSIQVTQKNHFIGL